MKKLTTLVLALVMVFSLAACGNKNSGTTSKEDTNKTEKPKTVTIKSFNANNEETDLEVPYDSGFFQHIIGLSSGVRYE